MKKSVRFVGLDVHKDSISVAVAEDGRRGEVRYMGTIGTPPAIMPVCCLPPPTPRQYPIYSG